VTHNPDLRKCPRCKRSYPSHCFAEPIALCLPCYGTSRGNQDLSIEQLRSKAHKSRKARGTETSMIRRQSILDQLGIIDVPSLLPCDSCNQMREVRDFDAYGDVCKTCGDERNGQSGDGN
jgi:hypothetical protein